MVLIACIRDRTDQRVVIGIEVWVRGRQNSICGSDNGTDRVVGSGHIVFWYVMLGMCVCFWD